MLTRSLPVAQPSRAFAPQIPFAVQVRSAVSAAKARLANHFVSFVTTVRDSEKRN